MALMRRTRAHRWFECTRAGLSGAYLAERLVIDGLAEPVILFGPSSGRAIVRGRHHEFRPVLVARMRHAGA